MENMALFFTDAELALVQYALYLRSPPWLLLPSTQPGSPSRMFYEPTPPKHHTGYTESQLLDRAKILVAAHSTAPESKLKVVYQKYFSENLEESPFAHLQ